MTLPARSKRICRDFPLLFTRLREKKQIPSAASHAPPWSSASASCFSSRQGPPSRSFNNTLHHLDPDRISCQQLDVWGRCAQEVVFRGKSASAVRPCLCMCVIERERSVCSVWFGLCLWAAVLRWAHHLWPRYPHLHSYKRIHLHMPVWKGNSYQTGLKVAEMTSSTLNYHN